MGCNQVTRTRRKLIKKIVDIYIYIYIYREREIYIYVLY